MSSDNAVASSLASLIARHEALDSRIIEEGQRPAADSETLRRLKVEKLHLKEAIERARQCA